MALGPEMRRGIADYNGEGDVVGGIVVMRQGENALNVIERVKAKLEELKPSLPEGVEVVTTYDRSELIERAIDTVKDKLIEEIIIVSLIILLFLWHVPSAIVPILTIPISVALAFIPMYLMGLNANLMSLAGIAISIGVLVDGAIVEVENAYNKIHLLAGGRQARATSTRCGSRRCWRWGRRSSSRCWSSRWPSCRSSPWSTRRAGSSSRSPTRRTWPWPSPPSWPSRSIRRMRMLFARIEPFRFRPRPLAWLATAALRRQVLLRGAAPDQPPPPPPLRAAVPLRACATPRPPSSPACSLVGATIPVYFKLGSEFMPPLREGTLLYMPSAVQPGMSVAEAQKALQVQDKILHDLPRGRARLRQGRPRQHLDRSGAASR